MSLLEPSADAVRPIPEHTVRRLLESACERATSVDLEAAFAWVAEGRLADDLVKDWRQLGEEAQEDLGRCYKNLGLLHDVTAPQDTMRYGRYAAEKILADELKELVRLADKAADMCERVRDDVIKDLGRLVRDRRTEFPSAKAAPLGELLEELQRARTRHARSTEAYRQEQEELNSEERRLQEFVRSDASISLDAIRRLSGREFELFVARLLERDGYEVQRTHGGAGDRGADVIALGRNGERIVVQCKLRTKPSAAIGAPAVQTFNGTARPDHQATHPIMVTNARFTAQAEEAAARYRIALVDSVALRAWATFGRPIELS
ncbi:restriction endonuclease (plasmid) [Streptomyces sp. NBC_01201]|uniref:restriction endonuclease n=1 Tax=Streptomyces sp. NBC_01201 TaxID=2903770 RepID=UPI002E13C5BD|nr:restriction endonuclease [Streptomyces sp. NBC_01201]